MPLNANDLKMVISTEMNSKPVDAALAGVGKQFDDLSKQYKGMLSGLLETQKKITAEQDHQNKLIQLRNSMDPAYLKEEVRRMRELESLQQQRSEAQEKERHRQERPEFFERLLSDPMKTLQDSFANLKDMFSSENAGDLMDQISNTFRGGVGEGIGKIFGKIKQKREGEPGGDVPKEMTVDAVKVLPKAIAAPAGSPATTSSATVEGGGGVPKEMTVDAVKVLPKAIAAPAGSPATTSSATVEGVSAVAKAAPAAGGMAGGAAGMSALAAAAPIAGIAIPLAVKAADKFIKGMGQLYASGIKLAAKGLEKLSGSLHALQGPLGPVGLGFDALSSGLGTLTAGIEKVPVFKDLFGPFAGALAGIPNTVKDITTTLTSFAGKASPAQLKMFQIALEDVQAVIGHSFLPVLDMMRESVRFFGDVLATILPNTEEMSEALAPLKMAFIDVRNALGEVAGDVGPLVRELFINSLHALAKGIRLVTIPITMFIRALASLEKPLGNILAIFGLTKFGEGMRSSEGAAARPAQLQSVDAYQQQLQLAAFQQPGQATMEQVPGYVGNIDSTLTTIGRFVSDIKVRFDEASKWIEEIRNFVKDFKLPDPLGVQDAANNAGSFLGQLAARFR